MFQFTCCWFVERAEISAVDVLVLVLVVVMDEAVVDEVEFVEAGLVVELVVEFAEF